MSQVAPTNLDLVCAETGRALAALGTDPKQIENTLTKALGVLQEQGVYALFLFLCAREKRRGVTELAGLLERHCGATGLGEHNGEVSRLERELQKLTQVKTKNKRERTNLKKKRNALNEQLDTSRTAFFEALAVLTEDLDRLLLARELLERALVYGRYHAKARAEAG